MGRLSDTIKQAAPKRRKLAGLERRWLVNNVSVMVVLAALCVAALAADGETVISEITHIDRGYEHIERDLAALGADIRRTEPAAA